MRADSVSTSVPLPLEDHVLESSIPNERRTRVPLWLGPSIVIKISDKALPLVRLCVSSREGVRLCLFGSRSIVMRVSLDLEKVTDAAHSLTNY